MGVLRSEDDLAASSFESAHSSMADGPRGTVRTESTGRSVEERICGDLVTAKRQLQAGNPDHALLNLVLLVNRDSAASLSILTHVLATQPPRAGRSLKARREAMLAEEIQRFRKTVDLCLWTMPAAEDRLIVEACLLLKPCLLFQPEEPQVVCGRDHRDARGIKGLS